MYDVVLNSCGVLYQISGYLPCKKTNDPQSGQMGDMIVSVDGTAHKRDYRFEHSEWVVAFSARSCGMDITGSKELLLTRHVTTDAIIYDAKLVSGSEDALARSATYFKLMLNKFDPYAAS